MKELTPKQIVKELNRYIIGQNDAKKAVAIALRNRWRRQQVEGSLRNEIMPNNIIMTFCHLLFACAAKTSGTPSSFR